MHDYVQKCDSFVWFSESVCNEERQPANGHKHQSRTCVVHQGVVDVLAVGSSIWRFDSGIGTRLRDGRMMYLLSGIVNGMTFIQNYLLNSF